jgi:hypothetical protein
VNPKKGASKLINFTYKKQPMVVIAHSNVIYKVVLNTLAKVNEFEHSGKPFTNPKYMGLINSKLVLRRTV